MERGECARESTHKVDTGVCVQANAGLEESPDNVKFLADLNQAEVDMEAAETGRKFAVCSN